MNASLAHGGLPAGVKTYQLLALVKQVSRSKDKAIKISRTALAVLEYCFAGCRESDFSKGKICGIWEQPATMAAKLGISTKVLHNAEAELREKGIIDRTSVAHARRYGERRNGNIISLAGLSFRPLIDGYAKFVAIRDAMQMQQEAASGLRHEICQLGRWLREAGDQEVAGKAEAILSRGRTSRITELSQLQAIKDDLEALLVFIDVPCGDTKTSDQTEEIVAPNILKQDSFENCSDAMPHRDAHDEPAQLTPARVAELASEDYKALLAANGGPSWPNLVDTSATVTSWLGISQSAWGEACQSMGRERAAICVLIIDRNWRLPIEHRYRGRRPAGCFKGMVAKGASKLNLNGMLRAAGGFSEGVSGNVTVIGQTCYEATPDRSAIGHFSSKLLSQIKVTECKEDHQC